MATEGDIAQSEPLVPEGAFASVAIADAIDEAIDDSSGLHRDELTLATTLGPAQRATFLAGRRALRAAIARVNPALANVPLLRTHRGAPAVPAGLTGSISHKRARAIALAAPASHGVVGVDLEERARATDRVRPSIANRILTAYERDALADITDPLAHRDAVRLRFALKEAVYKAIDPYVERYVRFTEVELDVHDGGRATVRLLLPELAGSDVVIHAHWRLEEHWIIALARSVRAD